MDATGRTTAGTSAVNPAGSSTPTPGHKPTASPVEIGTRRSTPELAIDIDVTSDGWTRTYRARCESGKAIVYRVNSTGWELRIGAYDQAAASLDTTNAPYPLPAGDITQILDSIQAAIRSRGLLP